LSAPGLVAAGLFAFVRGWNDFIFALTLAGPDKQTLPPGLVNTFVGEAQTAWPQLMAASLVVSLPVVIGFVILQRYLVGGLTAGAVTGCPAQSPATSWVPVSTSSSRRTVLKLLGAGASAAGLGGLVACAPSASNDSTDTDGGGESAGCDT